MDMKQSVKKNPNLDVKISDIGPIKQFNATLEPITILIGRPNSGKSYALRSIYLFLQALDKFSDDKLKKEMEEVENDWNEIVSFSEVDEFSYSVLDYLIKTLKTIIEYYYDESLGNRESRKEGEVNTRTLPEVPASLTSIGKMNASFQSEVKVNRKLFTTDYTNLFKRMMKDSIDSRELEKIVINGRNLISLINESADSVFYEPNDKFSLNVDYYYPFPFVDVENSEEAFLLRRILREIKFNTSIEAVVKSVDVVDAALVIQVNIGPDLETTHKRLRRLVYTRRHSLQRLLRYLVRMENLLNTKLDGKTLDRVLFPIASELSSELDKVLFRKVQTDFKKALKALSGVDSVKFIPYGRSAIIQFEELLREEDPFDGIYGVMDDLGTIKGTPLAGYFYWLNKGKTKVGAQDDILQELFSTIMGGKLSLMKDETLGYHYNEDKVLDVNLSSAMVEEMTGLMLPLLTSSENELVLIEEPEAQLHVSVQILMGLLLLAIAKKKKLKIIFTTHSDLLALTLHYAVDLRPDTKSIAGLIGNLLPGINPDGEAVRKLAEIISDDNNPISLSSYYIDQKGVSMPISKEEFNKSVPTISNTVDTFFKWTVDEIYKKKNRKETEPAVER